MSSDDDDAVLQRHKGKLGPALARARPALASETRQAGARQSKEALPQKLLQRTLSTAQQSKQSLTKTSSIAAAEQDSDDDAQVLKRHQLKLQQQSKVQLPFKSIVMPRKETVDVLDTVLPSRLQRGFLQAAVKPPAGGNRLTSRSSGAKAAAEGLNRTVSSMSTSRQSVTAKPADSDSDTDVAVGSRLRSRADTSQQTRKQSKPDTPARNKQPAAAPAESDSDDDLLRRRSKQAVQPASSLAQRTKLCDAVDRRSSRDSRASTSDRLPAPSQLGKAAATPGKHFAGKQQAAALAKDQPANVEATDDDSDEDHWRAKSARPSRARPPQAGPVQVKGQHQQFHIPPDTVLITATGLMHTPCTVDPA